MDRADPIAWRAALITAGRLPEDLAQLVDAAARGDREAAGGVLVRLAPRVRNAVRLMTRGDSSVDDLTQEALVAICRALPKYEPTGSFLAWADRVAFRAAIDALRRGRTARLESPLDEDAGDPTGGGASASVSTYLERRALARCLDALPEEQRSALVLHFALDLSIPEIALEVDAPEETVRSRIRLAKGKIRACMGLDRRAGEER